MTAEQLIEVLRAFPGDMEISAMIDSPIPDPVLEDGDLLRVSGARRIGNEIVLISKVPED